jgi:HPt (histidine-containing phosphotransfer) domain-containing protein
MANFDLKKVLGIVENDKGMARTLLQMTVDLGSVDMLEMRKLTNKQEYLAAGNLAHKLKSSTATLGFHDVSDLMKELEHYSKTEVDPLIFEEKLNNLEYVTNELFGFIRQALASELK